MIDDLLSEISKLQNLPLSFIGIDGPGGVGKTTLANLVKKNLNQVQIVHMDDFDVVKESKMRLSENRPVGPDTDWHKVLIEVLMPLKIGKTVRYKRYDRSKDRHIEDVILKPSGILIIEGVFAVRRELFSYYDYTIWVDCSFDKRIKRALTRDGEVARDLWEKDWLPMEEKYIKVYKPQEYVDLVMRTENDISV